MKFILKIKDWKLFIPIFIIPALMTIGLLFVMPSIIRSTDFDKIEVAIKNIALLNLLRISIPGFFYFWWLITAGVYLQKFTPKDVKLKVNWFVINFIFLTIAIFVYAKMMFSLISSSSFIQPVSYFLVMIFLVILFGKTIIFVAKTMKTVELQREAKFREYAAELCMILLFPIGLWALQHKLNQYFENDTQDILDE